MGKAALLLVLMLAAVPAWPAEQRAAAPAPVTEAAPGLAPAPGELAPPAPLPSLPPPAPAPASPPTSAAPPGQVGPLAAVVPVEGTPLDIFADQVRYLRGNRVVVAQGHVRAVYQDLEVRADQLTADLAADTAVFTGHAALLYQGQTFEAESLLLNLESRLWQLRQARAGITPSFFERGVRSPVYIGGEAVSGGGRQVVVEEGSVTTCNLPSPHYHLGPKRITIYPGRRLIARDVSFWLGRRRLVTLPSFHVSLVERQRPPIVPQVGQNEIDGTFLKTRYNYQLADNLPGSVLVDVMSRRGLGTGIEQGYGSSRVVGNLLLYRAADPGGREELLGRLRHGQDLGDGWQLTGQLDVRHNAAYYLGGTTVMDNQLTLQRTGAASTSRVYLTYNRTQGFGDYSNLLGTIEHVQRVGSRQTWTFDTDYQRNTLAPGLPADVEVNNRVQLVDRQRPFDLTLDVTKRLDPDNYPGDDFYQVLDRLPELRVESTSYRLPALRLLGLPARASVSVGEFFEMPTDLRASRLALAYDTMPRRFRLGGGGSVNVLGGFRQTLYGDADHTAQYTYNASVTADQPLTRHWSLRGSYYLLEPKGYTPFRFDYVGSYETATAGLTFDNGRAGRASLLTGYDFENATWRNLQARLSERLSRTTALSLSTTYNFNRGEQQDMSALVDFADSRAHWLVGLRYDPRSARWRRIVSQLDWRIGSKWRLEAINGWDGSQRRFIYNEFLLVRDLHCWEALLYYSQSRRLFRMDLRIKAFEWGSRDFGVARSGQMISPVPPEVY